MVVLELLVGKTDVVETEVVIMEVVAFEVVELVVVEIDVVGMEVVGEEMVELLKTTVDVEVEADGAEVVDSVVEFDAPVVSSISEIVEDPLSWRQPEVKTSIMHIQNNL